MVEAKKHGHVLVGTSAKNMNSRRPSIDSEIPSTIHFGRISIDSIWKTKQECEKVHSVFQLSDLVKDEHNLVRMYLVPGSKYYRNSGMKKINSFSELKRGNGKNNVYHNNSNESKDNYEDVNNNQNNIYNSSNNNNNDNNYRNNNNNNNYNSFMSWQAVQLLLDGSEPLKDHKEATIDRQKWDDEIDCKLQMSVQERFDMPLNDEILHNLTENDLEILHQEIEFNIQSLMIPYFFGSYFKFLSLIIPKHYQYGSSDFVSPQSSLKLSDESQEFYCPFEAILRSFPFINSLLPPSTCYNVRTGTGVRTGEDDEDALISAKEKMKKESLSLSTRLSHGRSESNLSYNSRQNGNGQNGQNGQNGLNGLNGQNNILNNGLNNGQNIENEKGSLKGCRTLQAIRTSFKGNGIRNQFKYNLSNLSQRKNPNSIHPNGEDEDSNNECKINNNIDNNNSNNSNNLKRRNLSNDINGNNNLFFCCSEDLNEFNLQNEKKNATQNEKIQNQNQNQSQNQNNQYFSPSLSKQKWLTDNTSSLDKINSDNKIKFKKNLIGRNQEVQDPQNNNFKIENKIENKYDNKIENKIENEVRKKREPIFSSTLQRNRLITTSAAVPIEIPVVSPVGIHSSQEYNTPIEYIIEKVERGFLKYSSDSRSMHNNLLSILATCLTLGSLLLCVVVNDDYNKVYPEVFVEPTYVFGFLALNLLIFNLAERKYDNYVCVVLIVLRFLLMVSVLPYLISESAMPDNIVDRKDNSLKHLPGVAFLILGLWFPIALRQSFLFNSLEILVHTCGVAYVWYLTRETKCPTGLAHSTTIFPTLFILLVIFWAIEYISIVSYVIENILIPEAQALYQKEYVHSRKILHICSPTIPIEKGTELYCPKRYKNCAILVIHVKAADVLPGLVDAL